MSKSLNFIDLFAGCGGMSEGFYRMGYNALAHVEIDPTCCKTLKKEWIIMNIQILKTQF